MGYVLIDLKAGFMKNFDVVIDRSIEGYLKLCFLWLMLLVVILKRHIKILSLLRFSVGDVQGHL